MFTPSPPILYIYFDATQVVQKYPKGTKKISLPQSVDLASLLIFDHQNNIISPSYKHNNTTPKPQDSITVTKGSLKYTGTLVSMTETSITMVIKDAYLTIRNYDTVMVAKNSESEMDSYLEIHSNDCFTISYLCSEITWRALGTGILTDSNLTLRLAGSITNNLVPMTAHINCIAGSISISKPSPHRVRNLAVDLTALEVSNLEDYTRYDLGIQTLNQTTNLELNTRNYPVIKFYEHYTNNSRIRFGYRFKTHQFIPMTTLYMYTHEMIYLGTTEVSEAQPQDEVDLLLNASTLVRCDTTIQVTEPDPKTSIITEKLETKIINHNTTDIALIIKHDLGNRKFIDSTCTVAKKRSHYLEWYFLIHPNTKETPEYFRCELRSTMVPN